MNSISIIALKIRKSKLKYMSKVKNLKKQERSR